MISERVVTRGLIAFTLLVVLFVVLSEVRYERRPAFLGTWEGRIYGCMPMDDIILRTDGTGVRYLNPSYLSRQSPSVDQFTWRKDGKKLVWTYKATDGKHKHSHPDGEVASYTYSVSNDSGSPVGETLTLSGNDGTQTFSQPQVLCG